MIDRTKIKDVAFIAGAIIEQQKHGQLCPPIMETLQEIFNEKKPTMKFEEKTVIEILALALDNSTPDHRLEYLLKKLYGLDSLNLDSENSKFFDRIYAIVLELQ